MRPNERLVVIAHELRSPIAALDALVDAARKATDPDLLARLMRLGIAAGRDVERICAGVELTSLDRAPVEVADLLGTCAALGAVTDIVPLGLTIEGDATRLRQALSNVIANGLRHGNVVVVAVEQDAENVVIDVTDDGSGFEAGLDVFAWGVSSAGSSGFGLWLARAIVEAHGGTLDIRPTSLPGACLRFVLPRASASD